MCFKPNVQVYLVYVLTTQNASINNNDYLTSANAFNVWCGLEVQAELQYSGYPRIIIRGEILKV